MTPESLLNAFAEKSLHEVEDSIAVASLIEVDLFAELQLLDIRMSCMKQIAGMLFEGRMALDPEDGDTGILIARQVLGFQWESEVRESANTAWNVVSTEIADSGEMLTLEVDFIPEAKLRIVARTFSYYEVKAENLSAEIPDYAGTQAEVSSALANWETPVTVVREYGIAR